MSELIKALKTNGSPQPMGFKTARETPAKPRLLIIASVNDVSGRLAENIKGANALLVTSELKNSQIKTVAEAADDIPWGCSLDSQTGDGLASAIKSGADFITFPPETPLKTLPEREVDRVLAVSIEAAEKLPRAVNDSPVDAVSLITGHDNEPLTWRHLMLVEALTGWLSKPLIVSVPDETNERELQSLWDAGAAGIMATTQPGNIARLRKIVDHLKYPVRRKAEEKTAVIPQVGFATTADEEDEDW